MHFPCISYGFVIINSFLPRRRHAREIILMLVTYRKIKRWSISQTSPDGLPSFPVTMMPNYRHGPEHLRRSVALLPALSLVIPWSSGLVRLNIIEVRHFPFIISECIHFVTLPATPSSFSRFRDIPAASSVAGLVNGDESTITPEIFNSQFHETTSYSKHR